jgi:hypothetical protein
VAWNGDLFLVVWADERDSSLTQSDIYAARVTATGAVLDPGGIPIARSGTGETVPAAASDGTNFFVVWEAVGIHGVRVNPQGEVLDPEPIQVSSANGAPSIAWNGQHYLVAWSQFAVGRADLDVFGTRITAAGQVVDTQGIPISTVVGSHQVAPQVASASGTSLVVWRDERNLASTSHDVYGTRISAEGSVLDPAGLPIAEGRGQEMLPDVASDGNQYLVVWEALRATGTDIHGARVSTQGTVLDRRGIVISRAGGSQRVPQVVWNGSQFMVLWGDNRSATSSDVYGARLDSSGTLQDRAGVLALAGVGGLSEAAWGDTSLLGVWSGLDTFGARVGVSLNRLGDSILLSQQADSQTNPAIAWNGTTFLVLWEQFGPEGLDILGARLGSDGSMLDPGGIRLGTGPGAQHQAAVASEGDIFLVVWNEGGGARPAGIYGARVTASGQLLDQTPIRVSSSSVGSTNSPTVAHGGSGFLVAWSGFSEVTGSLGIYAQRVGSNGNLIGGEIPVHPTSQSVDIPAAAWANGTYLVAWERGRFGFNARIEGARIGVDGTVLDPIPIQVSGPTAGFTRPAVTSDGINFLVAWDDRRNSATLDGDIFGARVGSDGSVLDPSGIAIESAVGEQRQPALAFDGSTYVVAWEDYRSGVCGPSTCRGGDLRGARISPVDGTVSTSEDVAPGLAEESAPALTNGPGSAVGLTYQRVARESLYGGVTRVFVRLIRP